MNSFQTCRNSADAVPLYIPQNLYLKPIARINVSVQLPQIEPGKAVSNWEIMEKLRAMVKPDQFCGLKVSKSMLEVVRFEAEIDDKLKVPKLVAILNGQNMKISTFPNPVKVRAAEAKIDFPARHTWDSFFRDAKNMNENKPGERPDTIHVANMPIKWFVSAQHANDNDVKPSQKIFHRLFEKFGHIRVVDIPICDPYRTKMKEHLSGIRTFNFEENTFFEGYVQYKDYVGFLRAMDAFRDMKLLRKEPGVDVGQAVNIKVDFDRTKHLSDASIKRRQIVREKLMEKEREEEEKEVDFKKKLEREEEEKRQREQALEDEKEKRKLEREERRKARNFARLNLQETDELKMKIEKEEKKLKKVERKLQAIRLVTELYKRIRMKHKKVREKRKKDFKAKDNMTKFKLILEQKLDDQKSKVNDAKSGQVLLSSILGDDDDDDTKSEKKKHKKKKKSKKKKHKKHKHKKDNKSSDEKLLESLRNIMTPNWYGFQMPSPMFSLPGVFPSGNRGMFHQRGRGMLDMPSTSRGFPRRRGTFNHRYSRGWGGRRGSHNFYTPEVADEYYKYFSKFLREEKGNGRRTRSRSTSRSRRSRSRSRRRSRSRSRSRRKSSSSSSWSPSPSRSRSRSRSKTYNKSKNSSYRSLRRRSRSRSRRSPSRSRSRRTRSWSRKSRSRSRSRSKSSRSRSRSKSSRSRRRTKSRSRSRRRSRSRSRSRKRNDRTPPRKRSHGDASKRSRSKSPKKKRSRSKTPDKKSRSPSYRSIDSSKFISPSRLRLMRSRSKSWSLPRANEKKGRSWSKSASP